MSLRIEFNAGDNTYLNGLDIRLHLGTKPSTGTVKSRYTINIYNKSAVDKDFMIFTGEPQVNGSIGGKPLTYVFMDGLIGSGNTGSFEFSPDIYAVCMQKTGRGVPQISTKGPIRLGTKDYKGETLRIALQNGIPRFIDNDPSNAEDGSFQICTGPDFDQGSKIYIGIGLKPEGGQVAMAAGVEASPNATVSFVPSTTCYAAPGNSKSGTIIDASQVGNKATFDFAYRSNSATVQYNPNGTWTQM